MKKIFSFRSMETILIVMLFLLSGIARSQSTTVNLEASDDTYLSSYNEDYNYGGVNLFKVTNNNSGNRRGALIKWDVSNIPANAMISEVTITVYVSKASSQAYNLYNMRRSWVEGTLTTGAASTTSANWGTYDGTNSWGTAGAASIETDRYNTNLWGAVTSSFSSTGSKTITLNSDGLAVVQGWINGTITNYGLTMQSYSSTSGSDDLQISSSENTSNAGPTINITYSLPSIPTITITGTLSAFVSQPGIPSVAQTYTVAGSLLTSDINITTPIGFEISTDGNTYSSSVTLAQTGGVVSSKTIYVRQNYTNAGTFGGNISHTSTGVANVNIAVNGTISLNPSVSLIVNEDTHIRSGNSRGSYNYGASATIRLNPYYEQGSTDGQLTGALLKWDFSVAGIPAGARVTSASLAFNVTDGSNYAYNLYNMRQAWVEGSNNAATGSGASWNYYGAGTGSWGTTGAQSTSTDRYDINLWNASASDFNTTGNVSFALNADGIAVVQGWIDGTLVNNGLTIQNYSGTTVDIWEASSGESTTEANRPRLNITYSLSSDPVISINGSLTPFTSQPGVVSGVQTYTVTGANLTENIIITAPNGFELSTTGSTYSSSLTLVQTGGSVGSTTIYVRMYSATNGTFSGNIAHTSIGATSINQNVSGNVSSSTTLNLEATEDTYMSSYNETYNYGSVNLFKVTNNNGGNSRGALMKWDVSSIPSNAVITSATMTLYVSTSSTRAYNLYNMRRSWVEGTLTTGAASTTSSNWQTYDGTNSWGTAGAANTETDRYNVNLWDAGTTSFSSTGSKTVSFNSDGIAVLQGWINEVTLNYGLTMQNYTTTSGSDDLQISSSENSTNPGPTLNIVYSIASGTTYSLTVTTDGNGGISFSPTGGVYTENTVVTLTPVPNSGYAFSSWDGNNDNDLIDNGNGTWSITMNDNKSLTATFSPALVNYAPNVPLLVQPSDNAVSVALSPVLQLTASDNNSPDILNVSFYGRAAGTTTASADFSMVLLPDIQNESQYNTDMLTSQANWIVAQKNTSNIVFVTTTGDMVNTSSSTTQYENADAAMDIIDAAGIPYSVSTGNHDIALGTTYYSNYFGTSRFSGKSWYGGSFDNYNTYSLFSASGNDFILINLQYSPTSAILNWADGLLKSNAARRAIIVQHDILNVDNSWTNQASFTALKDNPNLFLMLCGHMHTSGDGAAYRSELGDDGHTIHIVQADYQDMSNGNGYLRILRFSPSDDMIYMTTYSPYTSGSITTSPDQMNMTYDLTNGATAPYTLIGTANNITNGSNASVTWSGLSADTEYEWYATVSDGKLSTTGSVWSFTTGNSSVTYSLTVGNDTHGTVTLSPSGGNYAEGTIVTLNPHPADGYRFNSWTGANAGDIVNTNNVYTIVMNGNKTISASFTLIPSITLTSPNGGQNWLVGSIHNITWTSVNTSGTVHIEYSTNNGTDWNNIISGTVDNGSYEWTVPSAVSTNCIVRVSDADGDPTDISNAVFTIASALNQHFIPVGTGNGFDHMNFYALTAKIDGVDLEPGDEIGIFDGTTCVGSGILTQVLNGTTIYLSMKVSRDDPDTPEVEGYISGNSAVFRIWDASEESEILAVNITYVSGDNIFTPNNSTWFYISGNASVRQEIILTSGWNIISLHVMPENIDMLAIVQSLIDAGSLVKVQNESGDAIEYNPVSGTWVNYIGNWSNSEGYKIRVNTATTLSVTGMPITETVSINLTSGWNIISYPVSSSHNALDVVNPLITVGRLTKVQDESGDAMELNPVTGIWINDIGTFDAGEGYKVKVSANEVLNIDPSVYGSGAVKSMKVITQATSTKKSIDQNATIHFTPVWTGNGLDHMNIYISETGDGVSNFSAGDEIGIFDGEHCVGSGVIANTKGKFYSVKVSADDPTTPETDGFLRGNRMQIKIWRPSDNTESDLTVMEFLAGSNNVFEPMGTSMISLNTTVLAINSVPEALTGLGDNYPNPFSDETTIPFILGTKTHVDLAIYNLLGQRVKTLINSMLDPGTYKVTWNSANQKLIPGIYLVKMITESKVYVKIIENVQ